VQADVRTLLLYGGLNLGEDDLVEAELEVQVGGGRRIDIETGLTAIETKRDLRSTGLASNLQRNSRPVACDASCRRSRIYWRCERIRGRYESQPR